MLHSSVCTTATLVVAFHSEKSFLPQTASHGQFEGMSTGHVIIAVDSHAGSRHTVTANDAVAQLESLDSNNGTSLRLRLGGTRPCRASGTGLSHTDGGS